MLYYVTVTIGAMLIVSTILLTPYLLKRRHTSHCRYGYHWQTEDLSQQQQPITQEEATQPLKEEPIPMPGMTAIPPQWEREFNEIVFPWWEEQRKENIND